MNSLLACQLTVVVDDGVEGLGEISGVVRGEYRVVVRLVPTPLRRALASWFVKRSICQTESPCRSSEGVGPAAFMTNCRRKLRKGKSHRRQGQCSDEAAPKRHLARGGQDR